MNNINIRNSKSVIVITKYEDSKIKFGFEGTFNGKNYNKEGK